ncbi:MAG TPA: CDP-alcohol phosphatidyltransferase family protein [Gemmatimonadaceae bacterium]
MKLLPGWVKSGYLRLVDPVAEWLVRHDVQPNTITTIGTLCTIIGGIIYGTGHIRTGGWFLGLTALFDVLDGMVARRTNRSSAFGAFYDSTLDRIADGFVLGGLAVFFHSRPGWVGTAMVATCILALIGAFVTSYTRARAEALGIDAKVGLLQRPERVVLLSAPQAFFGLALGGLVLIGIVILLTITAWITAAQRMAAVRQAARREHVDATRAVSEAPAESMQTLGSATPRPLAKGE